MACSVMWRLNWIHPFRNGSGRTSRAAAYMVLQVKHGNVFPSKNSIIAQIVGDRSPYYAALQRADAVTNRRGDDVKAVAPMEALMAKMLKEQIRANL